MTVRYLKECKSSSPVDMINKNIFDMTITKYNDTQEHITGFIHIPNSYLCAKVYFLIFIVFFLFFSQTYFYN